MFIATAMMAVMVVVLYADDLQTALAGACMQ